jgi:osmoprotectant transport system substrate-binding protein
MKKAVFVIIMLAFLTPGVADACVGKKLIVGVTESTESKVLAEVLATLVNERTGTTVEVYFYDDVEQIYDAVKEKVVDISIENTTRAMNLLNMPPESDVKKAYKLVKATYEKEKGLVWLKPFQTVWIQKKRGKWNPIIYSYHSEDGNSQ